MKRAKLVRSMIVLLIVLCAFAFQPARAAAPTDVVLEVAQDPPINLYAQPGLSAQVLRQIGNGNRMTWNTQYTYADGRAWLPVEISGVNGWISPDDGIVFTADPTRITPLMDRGTTVVPETNAMSLYQQPGRGQPIIATIPVGTPLRVVDAPVVTDLYTWWPVQVVNGTLRGWIVDTARELRVVVPLTVYTYQVCDNFDLKRFGVAGWDSVIQTFPAVIPPTEQVVCLASTTLRGDTTPVVVVLTHFESDNLRYDTLYIFDQRSGGWFTAYRARALEFSRTARLSLHDLTGTGVPVLLWAVRADGTGGYLDVQVLRYDDSGQIVNTLQAESWYKGGIIVNAGLLHVTQAVLRENEANCCPTGMNLVSYQWQNGQFVAIANAVFNAPGAAQSAPR